MMARLPLAPGVYRFRDRAGEVHSLARRITGLHVAGAEAGRLFAARLALIPPGPPGPPSSITTSPAQVRPVRRD
jgi:hypothetical protein